MGDFIHRAATPKQAWTGLFQRFEPLQVQSAKISLLRTKGLAEPVFQPWQFSMQVRGDLLP
jgi:hypothetical protein